MLCRMFSLTTYAFKKCKCIIWNWWGLHMPRKRVIKPRLWLFAMASFTLIFFLFYSLQGKLLSQQDMEIKQLTEQKEQAEMTGKELSRKIDFTKTDTYVERVAREELGLLRPDEIRFVEAGS